VARSIPDDQRIFVIEDTAEIQIDRAKVVRLVARSPRRIAGLASPPEGKAGIISVAKNPPFLYRTIVSEEGRIVQSQELSDRASNHPDC